MNDPKAFSVKAVEINALEVARSVMMTVNIEVKNMNVLRARIWVGSRIMMLGAWVMGVGRCEIVAK